MRPRIWDPDPWLDREDREIGRIPIWNYHPLYDGGHAGSDLDRDRS